MRNMRNKILSILNAATTPDCGACEYYKTDCGRYGCNGWQISDNTLNEITNKILELTEPLKLNIRLERDDDIPAFAAFLRCTPPSKDNHVMILNVSSSMSPFAEDEDGEPVAMDHETRIRGIIQSLMHEFGHALESQFGLSVNEEAIEKACEDWDDIQNVNTLTNSQLR